MNLRNALLVLIVAACAVGLSLHLVAESLAGVGQPATGAQAETFSDFPDDDQFVLGEPQAGRSAPALTFHRLASRLRIVPSLLRPLLHPPRFS